MKKMKAAILCLLTISFYVFIPTASILWGEKSQEIKNTVASSETAKSTSNKRRLRASITRGSDEDTMAWEDCLNNLIYSRVQPASSIKAPADPYEEMINRIKKEVVDLSVEQVALLNEGMALLAQAHQEAKELNYIETLPSRLYEGTQRKLNKNEQKKWQADLEDKQKTVKLINQNLLRKIQELQKSFTPEKKRKLWDVGINLKTEKIK